MRILVADITGTNAIIYPVSEFLGLGNRDVSPIPERLIWRGHEMLIKPGISIIEAEAFKPDFVMALMGWGGIGPDRSKFYEYFFDKGIPVFTWGSSSDIPKLMVKVITSTAESKRIVFYKPDHPILAGVKPEDIKTSDETYRTLVKSVKDDIGLAYDPDNASWEILYLEERFGNHRWLHYHPYPTPPSRLIDNMLSYMTRPKNRITPSIIAGAVGAGMGGAIAGLSTRGSKYGAFGAVAGGVIGTIIGWLLSD